MKSNETELKNNTAEKKKEVELQKAQMEKFHEIELEKIISATQTLYTTRVTMGSITISVGLAVLGVAFSQASWSTWFQALLFFVAAGVTMVFILLDSSIKTVIATHYFRCIELMEQYSIRDENTLSSIFAFNPKAKKFIRGLLSESPEIRYKKLERFGLKFRSFAGFWLPLLSIIADIVIGIALLP